MIKHVSYICIFVLTLFSFNCLAGIDTTKVRPYKFLEITGGALFPTAAFVQSPKVEYGGYTGYDYGASLSWPVKGYFSGTLTYSYGVNQFNAISTNNATSYVYPLGGVNCTEKTALIGVCYMIPGDDKASLDIRMAGGVLLFASPEASYSESNIFSNTGQGNALPQYSVQAYSFTSFIFNAGASLRCKLGKRIVVSVNIDYYYSPGNGNDIITTYQNSTQQPPNANKSFTFYSMFNPSLGFGCKIGR